MTRARLALALAPLRASPLRAPRLHRAHRASSDDVDVPPRVGDVVRVECASVTTTGEGVCRLPDGRVFLCRGATPGERVEATVTRVKKTLARGTKTRTIEPSPRAVEPRCPHHGTCGGCEWQHLAYDAQAALKRDVVADAMTRVGKVHDANAIVDACERAVETYESVSYTHLTLPTTPYV